MLTEWWHKMESKEIKELKLYYLTRGEDEYLCMGILILL